MKRRYRYRSAKHGRFVPAWHWKRYENSTIRERVK
jgi:hypothetical protein